MMKAVRSVSTLLATVVVTACTGAAATESSVSRIDLRDSSGTIVAADVDRIERVVSLRSGHVAFAEPYRRRVVFVDTATGRQSVYGRDGRGPGEFSTVLAPILLLQGDSVAVVMRTGRLFQVFTASKGFAFSRPSPIRSLPREFDCHTDDSGTIYCRIEGASTADGPIPPSEPQKTVVPVVRFRLGDTSIDSVWTVPGRGYKSYRGKNGDLLIRVEPLYPISGFGVSRDGALWRVSGLERRVEVRDRSGATRTGSDWGLAPRKVSSSERDSILDAAREGRFGDIPLSVHPTWPVFNKVIVASSGAVWVRLSAEHGNNRYRVFDAQVRPVADVDLRPSDTVVGLSEAVAYVLREETTETYSLVALKLPGELTRQRND